MSEKVEFKSALNAKTLVIAIIFIIIGVFVGQIHYGGENLYVAQGPTYWTWYPANPPSGPGWRIQAFHGHGPWGGYSGQHMSAFLWAFGFAMILVIVCAVANQIRRETFTRQEVALMTIMVITALFWYTNSTTKHTLPSLVTFMVSCYGVEPPPYLEIIERSVSPVLYGAFVGQRAYWHNFLMTPGNPVPWGTILPSMIYFTVWIFCTALVAICASLLVRRLYVDVEMLPFPISTIQYGMVELTQSSEGGRVNLFANKFFLIGFAIQFLWLFIPITANMIRFRMAEIFCTTNPLDPSADFWYEGITGQPIYPIFVLGTTIGEIAFLFEPWLFGMGVFLPIDVLVTFLATFLIFGIILPAATVSIWNPEGLILSPEDGQGVGSVPYLIDEVGGFFNYPWVGIGMFAAFAIVPLIRNRSYFANILKALVGKEPPETFDPEKPMQYRFVWWLLIISGLITLGLAALADVDVKGWVMLMVILTVLGLGIQRMVAEAGGIFGTFGDNGAWVQEAFYYNIMLFLVAFLGLQGIMENNVTRTVFMTAMILGNTAVFYQAHLHTGAYAVQAQNVGKKSRLKLRDVFIGICIAIILSLLASQVFTWWLRGAYYFNWDRMPYHIAELGIGEGNWHMLFGYVYNEPWNLDPANTIPRIIAGFIAVAVIYFVRGRWPWFRVSAAGAALYFSGFTSSYFFIPYLLALIVKYLAVKVGGVDFFTKKIQPLALGFFCAAPLVWTISSIWPALIPGYNICGLGPYPWFMTERPE